MHYTDIAIFALEHFTLTHHVYCIIVHFSVLHSPSTSDSELSYFYSVASHFALTHASVFL